MSESSPLVLVVDDEDAGRYVKAQVLRRAGFEVVEACTGSEALMLAVERMPEVIVLDVNLPDMSGFEVARQLRDRRGGQPGIPILQVSNTAITTADRVAGLESGADVYLTEPVAGEILVATVRALRRVRAAEKALAAALESEREARRIAEEASRLKDEFIATLSHELRTPLNALMGWIYQLRHSALDERTRSRALESLERNARVQAQLINDLLDISRISNGKLHLCMQLLDLRAAVQDAADAVRPAVDRKHLQLSIAAPQPCWVVGDYGRLQQIATNLLTNAVQFTPEGGRVDIEVRAVGEAATLTVSDSGVGIGPELLPYVFDRFRQGEAPLTRRHGGLGLGLAVVRQLVELHGGSVAVASRGPNQGSRFTVALPGEAESPASTPGAEPVLSGVRVLIVHRAAAELAPILAASGADTTALAREEDVDFDALHQLFDVVVADTSADFGRYPPTVHTADLTSAGQLVRSVMRAARGANSRAGGR